jgi:hypothetical protein
MSCVAQPHVLDLKNGPSMLVRVIWVPVIGWWLTGLLMGTAWFLAIPSSSPGRRRSCGRWTTSSTFGSSAMCASSIG